MVASSEDASSLVQIGLAELLEAAQQQLARSAPPSPRSLGKRRAIDTATNPFVLPPCGLPTNDAIGEHGNHVADLGFPHLHRSSDRSATDAGPRPWPDWVCCDIDHALAATCVDCKSQPLHYPAAQDIGSHRDAVVACSVAPTGAPGPSGASAIACCEASPCPLPATEVCDGVHSSTAACFDSTCVGSSPCSVAVTTCCDRPGCSDDTVDVCTGGSTECCDEPYCSDPRTDPALVQAMTATADCPDCKLPVSKNQEQPHGRMYSSFQELLDCCCCRSALPHTIAHVPLSPQRGLESTDGSRSQSTPEHLSQQTAHAHPTLSKSANVLGGSSEPPTYGLPAHHDPADAGQGSTPSSVTMTSSQRTPLSFATRSTGSPSLTTSTASTPYGAGHTSQKPTPGFFSDRTDTTPQHSRSSSLTVPTHPLILQPSKQAMAFADTHLGFSTPGDLIRECLYPRPHDHDASGGCIQPSWTVCNAPSCDSVGAHSHWLPPSASHMPSSSGGAAQSHQASATASSASEDARPQRCLWGGCHEKFWTVEELVAHVNHAHLAKRHGSHQHAPVPPHHVTSHDGWQYPPDASHYPGSNGGGQEPVSSYSSPAPSSTIPCQWNDCHSVSLPAHDVQLDEVVALLRDAGMQWPSEVDAINHKASAAVLQHLLTEHLGQTIQPRAHSDQHVTTSVPSIRFGADQANPLNVKRSRSPSKVPIDSPLAGPAIKRSKSSALAASTVLSTHDEEDCGCDNVQVGEDGRKGHVCGWEGCSKVFPNHESLTEHITQVHVGSGKAIYECRWVGCDRFHEGRQFAQKQKVLRHIQTHTGDRPHKCEICGRRFSEPNTLAQHMRTHTQERPYVCDYPGCGKAFSVTGSLTIHKRIHSGAKPFVCKFPGCGKAFAESSNLTKHARIHSGEKPFGCPECGKKFSRPDQVSRHRKTHERKRSRGKGGDEEAEEGETGEELEEEEADTEQAEKQSDQTESVAGSDEA